MGPLRLYAAGGAGSEALTGQKAQTRSTAFQFFSQSKQRCAVIRQFWHRL